MLCFFGFSCYEFPKKVHYLNGIFSLYRKIRYPHTFFTSFYPCNAGIENICIGDDGRYYLCNHFVGGEAIGEYNTGIPNNKTISQFIKKISGNSICGECIYLRLCGGTCYHKLFMDKAPTTMDDCTNWIEIIKMVIRSYVRLSLINPHALDMLCDTNKGWKKVGRDEINRNINRQIYNMEERGIN